MIYYIISYIIYIYILFMGRDSSLGIATRYRLDGQGIESRWGGEIFRTHPDRPWGPPNLLHKGYRVFPGGKAAGAWRWTPTPSSAEVKEKIELYLYSPSASSWPVTRWPLPLPYINIHRHVSLPSAATSISVPHWNRNSTQEIAKKGIILWPHGTLKMLTVTSGGFSCASVQFLVYCLCYSVTDWWWRQKAAKRVRE